MQKVQYVGRTRNLDNFSRVIAIFETVVKPRQISHIQFLYKITSLIQKKIHLLVTIS